MKKRKLLFNKYVLSILAFIAWISFFDQYSFTAQHNLSKSIAELENDKKEYIDKLEKAIESRDEIMNDKEKYAREQYMFHKENEEVILIPTKD